MRSPRTSGSLRSPASCATRPTASTTRSKTCSMRPASAASRSGRGRSGSSRKISSMRRSSGAAGGFPPTTSPSTWRPTCRSSTSIPCWSSRRSGKSSTTPRNIRPPARRSRSRPSATAMTWCCPCAIAGSGSPRRRTRRSASDFSAARARRRRRAPGLAFGSQRPSSAPTAASSRRQAPAQVLEPRCRSTCPLPPPPINPRSVPMSEENPVVLVVDDEVQIRRFLRAGLELDGFSVQDAETGADALRWATIKPPDLVILDLGLPDMDGSEVLERLRAWSSVPLIVLSVRSNEAEKVRLLESGADDYVVKPFGMAELLARAHAAMRRHVRVSTGEPVVKVGPLAIDLAARIVTINGARVMLTPKEYRLLQLLAQHAGNVVTHQFLLKEVWGSPHLHDTHYLRIFVRKLRQKIEVDPTQPRILLTELGVGYRLVVPEGVSQVAAAN